MTATPKGLPPLKVLALDIETAPNLCYTWGLFNQNIGINQIKEHPRIICFSAQWEGEKKVLFWSEYHDSVEEMLSALHMLLDECDVLVGWNSKGFDAKWIEGELQLAGFPPISPFHHLDLLLHFRKHSRFVSKKLDYVSERLLAENKVTHDGMIMWRACIEPDFDPALKKKYWTLMKKYAIKDTALLFQILDAVRGWVKMPTPVSADGDYSCPNCGSLNVQQRGYYRTPASLFKKFVCMEDKCGKWGRAATRERATNMIRSTD